MVLWNFTPNSNEFDEERLEFTKLEQLGVLAIMVNRPETIAMMLCHSLNELPVYKRENSRMFTSSQIR